MTLTVVNMIPSSLSGESNQDSEPNLAVDPADPSRIAGSAFTPNPMGGANCPIFVSTDGGSTWVLNAIVPSQPTTGDITVRFGGTTGHLYSGILVRPAPPGSLWMQILRTNDFTLATPMTVLVSRTSPNRPDQPYVQAATKMGGPGFGTDRVYVGNNDRPGTPAGQTATVDTSLDGVGATPPPPSGFTNPVVEARGTVFQDGPPVRPAIHGDGTVYGVFYGWRSVSGSNYTTDVVVVRDDDWGSGGTPFTALTDPGDGLAGRRVVTGVIVPWINGPTFGQERFVSSNISIAVDPRDSSNVYVAWADLVGSTYTLHVRRSQDRGGTWSADLRTISSATNPALAVNVRGKVGFLYQQLTGTGTSQRWVTHLELTTSDWASVDDQVLATVPANAPAPTFLPYIGDYVHLLAVGKDFYGIFSANNTPNPANFPNGVTYQRNADWGAQTLLSTDGVTPVPVSIDPYFFKETELAPDADFYVRDWTDSMTSGDTGLEPSTHPFFYLTSDVWTRRTAAPGGFNANDQPINEPPQHGVGADGDNFAFARIRRNASGSVATVTSHFLVSPLGTGSNYQDAGVAADPTTHFGAGNLVRTTAPGYPWHLDPTSTTHLCLAVEISAPNDPVVAPSLVGRAPGWPTTDLSVLYDNNKAQRNMEPGPAGGSGTISFYGLVHNAATFRRDVLLHYAVLAEEEQRVRKLGIGVIGSRTRWSKPEGTVVLERMEPGENRWISVTVEGREGKEDPVPIAFTEMVGEVPVNGFAIAPQALPLREMLRWTLELSAFAFGRMAAAFGIQEADEDAERVRKLSRRKRLQPDAYLALLRSRLDPMEESSRSLIKEGGVGDPFDIVRTLADLRKQVDAGDAERAAPVHATLANKLDAFETLIQKESGDPADILQMVEWHRRLCTSVPRLRKLRETRSLLVRFERFAQDYGARKLGNDRYPALIRSVWKAFEETAKALPKLGLADDLGRMREALGSPGTLQRAHRGFLLKLQTLEG